MAETNEIVRLGRPADAQHKVYVNVNEGRIAYQTFYVILRIRSSTMP